MEVLKDVKEAWLSARGELTVKQLNFRDGNFHECVGIEIIQRLHGLASVGHAWDWLNEQHPEFEYNATAYLEERRYVRLSRMFPGSGENLRKTVFY